MIALLAAIPGVGWLAAVPALARSALDFLRSPVGTIAVMAGLALGGFVLGHHRATVTERARCETAKAESIEAARKVDADAAEAARAKAEQQQRESDGRMADMQKRIDDYERDHKSCAVGDEGAGMLNGVGGDGRMQPGSPLPGRGPVPPARPGRRAP